MDLIRTCHLPTTQPTNTCVNASGCKRACKLNRRSPVKSWKWWHFVPPEVMRTVCWNLGPGAESTAVPESPATTKEEAPTGRERLRSLCQPLLHQGGKGVKSNWEGIKHSSYGGLTVQDRGCRHYILYDERPRSSHTETRPIKTRPAPYKLYHKSASSHQPRYRSYEGDRTASECCQRLERRESYCLGCLRVWQKNQKNVRW